MPQVEHSPTFVVFTDQAGEEQDAVRVPNDSAAIDYFRKREWAERAAAKRAESVVARSVHQTLAQHYAALSQRPDDNDANNRGNS